jgi:hypothetical protein
LRSLKYHTFVIPYRSQNWSTDSVAGGGIGLSFMTRLVSFIIIFLRNKIRERIETGLAQTADLRLDPARFAVHVCVTERLAAAPAMRSRRAFD